MKDRCRRVWSRSVVVISILFVMVIASTSLWSVPRVAAADFPAPMPPRQAAAVVAAARRSEEAQRRRLMQPAATPTSAITQTVQMVYVAQTGQHLGDRHGFLRFWRTRGGVLIFGYPISEELVEAGRVVQYFERARFEFHPEEADPAHQVKLSLLGVELTKGRDFPKPAPGSGERFFPETGHAISGAFYDFWRKRGGLDVFGHPISEPMSEVSPVDGQPRTVQYFERARFEHHPEDMDPFYRDWADSYNLRLRTLYEVQLGDLGRQAAARRSYSFARTDQQPGVPEWSSVLPVRRIDINLSTQSLTAYEDDLPVFNAPVATGRDGFNTPTGSYAIYERYVRQDMAGNAAGESWYVANVPWVQYVVGGIALHGTYWHDQWGTGMRMSHGCINLNIDDAQWLYGWAGIGTQVNILP